MFLPLPDQKIQSASAISDQSGNYILGTQNKGDGAMQGNYIVTVSKTETIGKLMTQEEQDAMPYSPVAGTDLKFKDALPVKYKTKDSSDLQYEVSSSQNNIFDIDLRSK